MFEEEDDKTQAVLDMATRMVEMAQRERQRIARLASELDSAMPKEDEGPGVGPEGPDSAREAALTP
jgi:hypothetical protein